MLLIIVSCIFPFCNNSKRKERNYKSVMRHLDLFIIHITILSTVMRRSYFIYYRDINKLYHTEVLNYLYVLALTYNEKRVTLLGYLVHIVQCIFVHTMQLAISVKLQKLFNNNNILSSIITNEIWNFLYYNY